MLGVDGVCTGVLPGVGRDLRRQPDASPLVAAQVEDDAGARLGIGQRRVEPVQQRPLLGEDRVRVLCDMNIDLKIKLPGFVVRKGVKMSAEIASKGFSKEVLKRKAAR